MKKLSESGLPCEAAWIATLLVLVAAVFWQTTGFGFVPYDDPVFITGNGYVREGFTLAGLKWAFFHIDGGRELAHGGTTNLWHPLTWLSHMMDVQWFGVNRPGMHHATSVLMHAVSGVLLYMTCRRLGLRAFGSWLAAALFLVHPLHVEPVAWVSSRKDVLSGMLIHAAIFCGLLGRMRVATGMFAAALLAKPVAVVTPLLLLLAFAFRSDGDRRDLNWWREKVLSIRHWFPLAGAAALAAIYFQQAGSHADFMDGVPPGQRALGMASGFLFLLWRSVWPFDLAFHYPWPAFGVREHLLMWGAWLGIAACMFRFRDRFPGMVWAMMWFTVCWLPVSGIFYVGTSFTADRYAYLGLTGLFIVIGRWAAPVEKPAIGSAFLRRAVPSAAIVVMAFLSWKQVGVWRNGWTLFEHAVNAQPRDAVAKVNLAGMFQQEGRFAEAYEFYDQAIDLAGKHHLASFNMGNCLIELGRHDEAEAAFQSAVEAHPGFSLAWRNLGVLLSRAGSPNRSDEAARDAFENAWKSSGERDSMALSLLFESRMALGEREQAEALMPTLENFADGDPRLRERIEQWKFQLEHTR